MRFDIDTNIDNETVWTYHVSCHEMFLSNGRDYYICIFCMFAQVFCPTMTDSDSSPCVQEKHGERFANYGTFSYDNGIFPFYFFSFFAKIITYDMHYAFWCSGDQS